MTDNELILLELGERVLLRIQDAKLWARYWEMRR